MYDKDIFEALHNRTKLSMKQLEEHPLNKSLYAETNVDDLVTSIEEHGLYEPLKVIRKDGGYLLVSGHRRLAALKQIFAEDWEDTLVPIDILPTPKTVYGDAELVVENNRYRQKSNEEIIAEGMVLEQVFAEKAGKRMIDGDYETGTRTRDLVGKHLGISGKTYAEGKKVIDELRALQEDNPEKAKEVSAALKKSIHGAAKAIKEEPKVETKYDYWPELRGLIKTLYRKHDQLKKFRNHTTGDEFSNLIGNIIDFAHLLETWDPAKVETAGPGWNKATKH